MIPLDMLTVTLVVATIVVASLGESAHNRAETAIDYSVPISVKERQELTDAGCPSTTALRSRYRQVRNSGSIKQRGRKLVFYHIPKAGGTTVSSLWLANRMKAVEYGKEPWRTAGLEAEDEADLRFKRTLLDRERRGPPYTVLQGHFGYGVEETVASWLEETGTHGQVPNSSTTASWSSEGVFRATVLREPVARVISAFFLPQAVPKSQSTVDVGLGGVP